MADVIDTLINILCQQGTQSQCSQFISSYPDITQQMIWLVFFPAVFLLIFTYLLAQGVATHVMEAGSKKKFQTLVAIALFIFIVFQGWYHYVLNISKFWFISLILLSGFFVLIHKMGGVGRGTGGSSSGQGGQRDPTRGLMAELGERGLKSIRGDVERQERVVRNGLNEMKMALKLLESSKSGKGDRPKALETFRYQNQAVETALRALHEMVSVRGFTAGSNYSKLEKEWEKLNEQGVKKEEKAMRSRR